jgi:hypothetical protein
MWPGEAARILGRSEPRERLCGLGETLIRQAISCDICGSEKRQTNHWFVAYDQAGELRVAGWSSRNRLRPGSKHLCGQTCLHKLVDEFMAKAISGRSEAAGEEMELPDRVADRATERQSARPASGTAGRAVATDAYVAAGPLYEDGESSARLVKPRVPAPVGPQAVPFRSHPENAPGHTQPSVEPQMQGPSTNKPEAPAVVVDAAPSFSSRQWRAEAWNRERSRELRSGSAGVNINRRSGS